MALRLVLLLLLVSPVAAAPATRCCGDRVRVAGERARQIARCHARAAARGVAVDPACLASVTGALAYAFGRLDGCPPHHDAALVSADLERVVGAVANALRPQPRASACAARKLKALGRFALSVARTLASRRPGGGLDETDAAVVPLRQRLGDVFAGIEHRQRCATTNDASLLSLMIASGVPGGSAPDGILRASLRLCPACGDGVEGGAEECDGADAPSCPGACTSSCRCPACGDGVVNRANETCDGADAPLCQGLCRDDCTCPTPVCGNGVREAGEECDGAALSPRCAACLPDCTCTAPVCGNGVVEKGESCDQSRCPYQGDLTLDCSWDCQCCYQGDCYQFGCCGYGQICMPYPTTGYCLQVSCNDEHPCGFGAVCGPNTLPSGLPGSGQGPVCRPRPLYPCFFQEFNGFFFLPCADPAVCVNGYCCLPQGATCTTAEECCTGLACTNGVCS
jgi:hypothetical protein